MSDETPQNTTPEPAPAAEAPETAPVVEEVPPARTCTNCSAPLADGQDWCLECGAAQPGRLGGRPGWRAALTVIGATVVLVGGAGAAAYAALSTDAQRDATAMAPPTAAPQVAPPPVITAAPESTVETAPVTPTTDTPPAVTTPGSDDADVPAPGGSDDPLPTPAPTPTPTPAPTPTPTPTPTPDDSTPTETTPTTETTAEAVPIDLPGDGAKIYDPSKRVAQADDPSDAIDDSEDTVFELPVTEGTVAAGFTVRLSSPQQLDKVVLATATPGFTVELYATTSSEMPKDVIDARWDHIVNKSDVGNEATLNFKKQSFREKKYRRVLLWFTKQPADTKVLISGVQIFPN
jgi:hypothetical protein